MPASAGALPARCPDRVGRMEIMSFRKLLPLFAPALIVSSSAAYAQFGVYGTVTGQRFGGITCPAFAGPCGDKNGRIQPFGGSFGGFYDFYSIGPARLGIDVRGDVLTANKRADNYAGGGGITRQYAGMAGVRGTFRTPISWLKPFASIDGGYIRNNASGLYTTTTTTNTSTTPNIVTSGTTFNPNLYTSYGLVKGFVGLDVKLSSFFDLRAIELGAGEALGSAPTLATVTATTNGAVTTVTSSKITTNSSGSHGLTSIGAGIVFHFPR